MKISVAMATYNGSKFIEQQLYSIFQQECLPSEIVICDDHSTDDTIDIIESLRKTINITIKVYRNKFNLGCTRNFEKAISLCKGDIIVLSDQDDYWGKEKLKILKQVYKNNLDKNVFINDSYYGDENLKRMDKTVLQRVFDVAGEADGHIAGSCTAITKKFRDFLIPFPNEYCPQYDVYIHRWAKLLKTKKIIDVPLQTWRIHRNNLTYENEMSDPKTQSIFSRYMNSRVIDPTDSYIKSANEFYMMKEQLTLKNKELRNFISDINIKYICNEIEKIVNANYNRANLRKLRTINRKIEISRMYLNGEYRYFRGLKSVLRDFLI